MTRGIARLGLAVFATILVLEHALATDLDPTRNRVSEYANARYGAWMVVGFLAWGVSLAASAKLTWGLSPAAGGKLVCWTRALATLLMVASAAAVLVALFRTVTVAGELPPRQAMTTSGRIHDLAALVVWIALGAAIIVSAVGINRPQWFRPLALSLGSSAIVLLAVQAAPGLVQRGSLLVAIAWQVGLLTGFATPEQRGTRDRTLISDAPTR